MLQIFKNMAKYWYFVILIIGLLGVQAYCDLALPQYTSDIIDTGIKNGGLSHILPERIPADEYDTLLLFMTKEEQKEFKDCYSKKTKKGKDAEGNKISYYKLTEKDNDVLDEKDTSLLSAVLINYQMSAVEVEQFKKSLWSNEQVQAGLSQAQITEEMFMAMSAEDIGAMMHMDIKTFEKTVEDEEGNKTKQTCIDMRKIFKAMAEVGMMDDSAITSARETFKAMSDSIGEATLKTMGIKWAIECETNTGMDMDKKQVDYLWLSGAKMVVMTLLMAVVAILAGLLASIVGASVGRDLREKVFGNVVAFSSKEMDQFSTASLITRCTNDVQQIQMVTAILLRMVLYAPIIGAGGIIKVYQSGANMGWIIALAVITILIFVMTLVSITMPKFKMMQTLIDAVNLVAREILTGLSVIRAFGREDKEEERFDEANTNLMKTQLFTNRTMTFMMPGMMLIMYGVNILIIWVAAHKIDEGILQVGTMVAFLTYAMQIVISFLMLTMMSIMLPRAGVAAGRIKEVIETTSSVIDTSEPKKIENLKGVVAFDHVHFRYPNAKEDVLNDISFVAKPGETTAIIGSTGCGKSTLVNLIPRLYDVTEGKITLDGVDVRELSMKELREGLGFVPQKAVLFSGTIASNLRFGKQDATDAEIAEAAEIAQATEFINEKKEKYESAIAQGGSNVSGGQKQRLSIARAIAKKPKVYIFDDSFSALDMKTDAVLRKALEKKAKNSTMIVVAQRISTIINADQILVLDDGEIVGKGTHKELLKTCEVYEQIAKSQLSEKELGLDSDQKSTESEVGANE